MTNEGSTVIGTDPGLTAAAFKEARESLGFSQGEIAVELGTTVTTIGRWERGEKRIGNPRMVRLALHGLKNILDKRKG